MGLPIALLKVLGKGVLNAVGGGVAGDVVVDVLPEVAQELCAWWKKGRTPEQRRAEVEALAQASPAELRQAVGAVVAEVAADRPAEAQRALSIYLSLLPGAVRRSLRRPSDPGGASPPDLLVLDEPEEVLSLLPDALPCFAPGDRPLPGIDWELEELLGRGGFGEVWKARNPHFDAVPPVALKFCLDPTARDRLLRHEASVLNQVMRQGKHPGIVPLQHTYLSADPPCLEYEFVSGGDLAGLIHEWQRQYAGPERGSRAARLLLDLARIVAFAHRLDPPIVHRDLKPANILVQPCPDGSLALRITDFGIGGIAAGQAIVQTRHNVSQGQFLVTALRGAHTPLYASPQQVRGAPADPRDDVHALGVIWYQLLTGNLVGGRPGGTRWLARLAELGMAPPLIELLAACVEEEAADRPADAAVLAQRLEAALAPAPVVAAPAAPREEEIAEKCPDCGGPMRLRSGKYGPFLGCAAFPRCRGTHQLPGEKRREPRPAPAPVALPPQVINSIGMKLVLVPAGSVRMGSPPTEAQRSEDEGPQREVAIARPFYLGIHPVTQLVYEVVMGHNPAHFTRANGGGPDHPVEQVSWTEAVEFCKRLSALPAERQAGRVYRLPTEAEWEYACRAGTATPFAFGEALSSTQANFDGTRPYGKAAPGRHLGRTSAVGSYRPNAWGLYDMHGNVWEWCQDWYTAGTHRVLRGGSWNNSGHLCRSARRQKYAPDFRGDNVGFRVALDVGS